MGVKVSTHSQHGSNSPKRRPTFANAFKHNHGSSFEKRTIDKNSTDEHHHSDDGKHSTHLHSSTRESQSRLSEGSSADPSILCFGTYQKGQEDRMNANHFAIKILFGGNMLDPVKENIDFNSSDVKVLDIGCGSGSWIMDMATEYPSAQFTGIDQVALFPHDIRPANVTFQKQDVLFGLDFEDDTFDFVQMRLFSLAFNRTQWAESLKEAYRVTKPGGYVQLLEVQLVVCDSKRSINLLKSDPGDEVVQTFVEKVCAVMEGSDQDPLVCTKLSEVVSKAGYTPVEDIRRVINLQTHVLRTELMYIINISIESCKRLVFEIYDIQSEEQFQELKDMYVQSRMNSSESAFHCCVGQKPIS